MPVLQKQSYQVATGPAAFAPVGGAYPPVNGGVTNFPDGEVAAFVRIFKRAPEQARDLNLLRADPLLMRAAQARALDLANRRYFSHVNPDGLGPNYIVGLFGYELPESYSGDIRLNNVESIAAGMASAEEAWSSWLSSAASRRHLTGSDNFFQEQVDFGIGRAVSEKSPYKVYWCFLSARRV